MKIENYENDMYNGPINPRKCGFGVVPSVPDGLTLGMSRMSKMGEETNSRSVQRDSKVSESCVQNGFWCSAVRLGRGFKSSLSERGHYTGTDVQNDPAGAGLSVNDYLNQMS